MKKTASVISAIFSPLLVPTYGMLLVAYLTVFALLPGRILWTAVGVVFLLTCLIPMTGILGLYKAGFIKDVGLNERTERSVPYIIIVLCYLGVSFFFYRAGAPLWLSMFFAGAALAAVINIIVNRWWKISAHGAAMGGLVALLFRIMSLHQAIYNLDIWISGAIIITGLVLTSRIYLGRHTLLQVLAGTANGYLCVWFLSLI